MALGVINTLGKYFMPEAAPYLLYAAVFVLLLWRLEGPSAAEIGRMTRAHPGLSAIGHALPWVVAIVYFYAAPYELSFGSQVMIWILFAMSLDLALGYAGILTLGQAGFFGLGAYAAGLFAIHVSPDPILGHLAAMESRRCSAR